MHVCMPARQAANYTHKTHTHTHTHIHNPQQTYTGMNALVRMHGRMLAHMRPGACSYTCRRTQVWGGDACNHPGACALADGCTQVSGGLPAVTHQHVQRARLLHAHTLRGVKKHQCCFVTYSHARLLAHNATCNKSAAHTHAHAPAHTRTYTHR